MSITKICPDCYQVNTVNETVNYCMWCGCNLQEEDIVDKEVMSESEWLDTIAIAAKIQAIKAKQLIKSFDKETLLNDKTLARKWWITFKNIENRLK